MKVSIAQAVAITTLLIGVLWSSIFLAYPISRILVEFDLRSLVGLAMFLLFSFPGLMCTRYGYKLLRYPEDVYIIRSLRWVFWVVVLFASSQVSEIMKDMLVPMLNDSTVAVLMLLLTILAAIPLYVYIVNAVRQRAGIMVEGWNGLFSHGFILFVAIQVWGVASLLFIDLSQWFTGSDRMMEDPAISILLGLVVPFLLAVFVDNFLARKAGLSPKRFRQSGPKHA